MASDNLRQVGRSIRGMNRNANYAIKRVTNFIPKRERARDTVSSVFPFFMRVESEGNREKVTMKIDFNKPPPDDCGADCISTACIDFPMPQGGHYLALPNPYVPGTVRVYGQGSTVDVAQFVESNPSGGEVYVQVQIEVEMIVVCFSYISC